MRLVSLCRHAVIPGVVGLALAALVSCTAPTLAGPASSAAVRPRPVKLLPLSELAADLEGIRAVADNPPKGRQWVRYRDEGGRSWYFWPVPGGRFCAARVEDGLAREVGCPTDPLPTHSSPAVNPFYGRSSMDDGRWVSFLYADQEELLELTCDGRPLAVDRIADFPTSYGRRTLYAVGTPWLARGFLHARVRLADGSTAPDQVDFGRVDGRGPLPFHEHLCA
ncbi:hypothetical protein ACFWP2_16145 [Kitasatospora sp. NPDC058444]|uniref:hypothetical protein n=1 Tax=Kitasatospora sp. NPDC058444 TaxID=3346504 RepID=UPI003654D98F